MKRNVLPVKDDILIEQMKRSMTALRQFRGWSMQQLGARAGVTKQTRRLLSLGIDGHGVKQ